MDIGQAFAGNICPHCQRHMSKGHDWNCPGAARHLVREIARADVIELERLKAENQKLRDALNKIAVGGDVAWHYEDIAREALK